LPNFSTKTGKIYQMTTNCTEWPWNIPFGRKICCWHNFPFQDLPKFTQTGILGLKIYQLATMPPSPGQP
jgi:hypothetical protein